MALIANELITNAAKHAFSKHSQGRVSVKLARATEANVLLSVGDNGSGLPAEFDLSNTKGLGMRVVAALTKQLGGDITHHSGVDGTEFVLLIPIV